MRPSWWEPQKVLNLLRAGMTNVDVAEKGFAECGGNTSTSTLLKDIQKWQRDPEWSGLFADAKSYRSVKAEDTSWWDDFFDAMEAKGGNIREAAKLVGISPSLPWTMADPRCRKFYNPAFAARMEPARAIADATIDGNLLDTLSRPGADPKVQLAYLKSRAAHVYPEKTKIDLNVSGTIQHQAPGGALAAANRAKVALLQAPSVAIAEPETILDAELVEANP